MLTFANHRSAKPADPIERTLERVLGGFERTPTGALDSKKYAGSLDFEFSKSWRGLKVKALKPNQVLTGSQKSKRKAGEDAVIADIRQSTRALNLDGTALIHAIKGPQRLTVGHVLECVRWMEFAARFEEHKPQVAALVLHLATIGKRPDQIDDDTFDTAIATLVASPSCTADIAWQPATRATAAPREPGVQRDEKSQTQPVATPAKEIAEAMFSTTGVRESKREESPTTTLVHAAQGRAPQPTWDTGKFTHATTTSPALVVQVVPQSSSRVTSSQAMPQVDTIAQELLAAKGGDKLTLEAARGLAELVLAQASKHDVSVDEMRSQARAAVLENKMSVGNRMFAEPADVTLLRQPARDYIANWKKQVQAAQYAAPQPQQRAIKVFATSS